MAKLSKLSIKNFDTELLCILKTDTCKLSSVIIEARSVMESAS